MGSMRMLGGALVLALVAGCSLLPPPPGIQVTIPAAPEIRALPVTVVDHAGIVRDATAGQRGDDLSPDTGVRAVPGRDDAVLFTWIGGSCDDRAIVTIDPEAGRYRITVDTQSSAMGCDAAGRFRTLLLQLTEPVGAAAFESS